MHSTWFTCSNPSVYESFFLKTHVRSFIERKKKSLKNIFCGGFIFILHNICSSSDSRYARNQKKKENKQSEVFFFDTLCVLRVALEHLAWISHRDPGWEFKEKSFFFVFFLIESSLSTAARLETSFGETPPIHTRVLVTNLAFWDNSWDLNWSVLWGATSHFYLSIHFCHKSS